MVLQMPDAATHVVAGVLRDARGRVLVAQRGVGKHLAGCWEFPGGKLDPGESAHTALRRELREELGVEIGAIEPLIGVPWCYPDKAILLDAYRVLDYAGEPNGREDQAIAWRRIDELASLDMPAPDRPIVKALQLPDRYAITPEFHAGEAAFDRSIERVLAGGVRLLQLRAKQLQPDQLRKLARSACKLAHQHGARLIINGPAEIAVECGADGMHLSSAELMRASQRPLTGARWLAASCHNEDEIRQANALGVDFAVVGPVMPTASHPGAEALGWARFEELAARAAFPVYALGGLGTDDVATARTRGAQGIAGISAFFAR